MLTVSQLVDFAVRYKLSLRGTVALRVAFERAAKLAELSECQLYAQAMERQALGDYIASGAESTGSVLTEFPA